MPTVRVRDLAISYERSASEGATPILFVHGAGGNAAGWRGMLARLPDALAVDLPGHGGSEGGGAWSVADYAAFLAEFLAAADLEGAVLAGHSMGGAVAIELALTRPERLAGLALIGTGGRLRVTQQILQYTSRPTNAADLAVFSRLSFGPEAPEALVAAHAEEALASWNAMANADFRACDAFDRLADLGRIAAPTLVVCGREDALTPVKFSKKLAEAVPGAELRVLAGVGHMPALEAPEALGRLLAEFRARLGRR